MFCGVCFMRYIMRVPAGDVAHGSAVCTKTRRRGVQTCTFAFESLSGSLPRIITQCPSAALPLQNRRYLQATRPRCIPLIILRANAEIPRQMLNMLCSCGQNLISRSHVFACCIIYTVWRQFTMNIDSHDRSEKLLMMTIIRIYFLIFPQS